jgi:hypothetical protein
MRLRAPQPDFVSAVCAAVAGLKPFALPKLKLTSLDGYLALTLATPSHAFQTLADACVIATDPFRLPPSDSELARRRRHGLTETQEALLNRWGYPHVLQEWRFHMTLSRRLTPSEMAETLAAAQSHFEKALKIAREVKNISLFVQAEAGADGLPAPFRAVERVALGA